MATLTDAEILKCFKNALANWRYDGFTILADIAADWLDNEIPNLKPRDLARLMHDYVAAGGIIDQQKETRPEWTTHDFHYDFRIPYAGRNLYIETRLICEKPDDPDDPIIHVVNIHDA